MSAASTTTPSAESPAEEYDRRLAERRDATKFVIRRCAKWWLAGHGCAVITVLLLFGALIAVFERATVLVFIALGGALIAGIAAALFLVLPAGRAAFVTLRDRSVLPTLWIVFGLFPWFGLSTEVFLALTADYWEHLF